MKNKDKTISLRLTNEEYSKLESNSNNLNMNTSQYLRYMINDASLLCGSFIVRPIRIVLWSSPS